MGYIRFKYVMEPPYIKIKSDAPPVSSVLSLYNVIDLSSGEDELMEGMPSVLSINRRSSMMINTRNLVLVNMPQIEIIDL